jgi:hypothetical protein
VLNTGMDRVAAAVPVPWQTATPVGIPKSGFPTERMAHVAARNIAAQIRLPLHSSARRRTSQPRGFLASRACGHCAAQDPASRRTAAAPGRCLPIRACCR